MDNIKREIGDLTGNLKAKLLLLEKMLLINYGKTISPVIHQLWESFQFEKIIRVVGAVLISMFIILNIILLFRLLGI
jgi:hypothetical protein